MKSCDENMYDDNGPASDSSVEVVGSKIRVHSTWSAVGGGRGGGSVERIDEYEMSSKELYIRKWRVANALGRRRDWEYEIGEADRGRDSGAGGAGGGKRQFRPRPRMSNQRRQQPPFEDSPDKTLEYIDKVLEKGGYDTWGTRGVRTPGEGFRHLTQGGVQLGRSPGRACLRPCASASTSLPGLLPDS